MTKTPAGGSVLQRLFRVPAAGLREAATAPPAGPPTPVDAEGKG